MSLQERRSRSRIVTQFEALRGSRHPQRNWIVLCRECDLRVVGKTNKIHDHVDHCVPKLRATVRRNILNHELVTTAAAEQPEPGSSVIETTPEEKHQLDLDWSRVFKECKIPTECADNSSFRKAIRETRPGYELPTKAEMAKLMRDMQEREA